MQLTYSWKTLFPQTVLDRYDFAETRNAASVLKATSPSEFDDIVDVLEGFILNVDKLTTPGKNKTVIARELDESFRVKGWREARFEQSLTTRLVFFRWTASPDPKEVVKEPARQFAGDLARALLRPGETVRRLFRLLVQSLGQGRTRSLGRLGVRIL